MSIFFWNYDVDPEFPFKVFEHITYGKSDRVHCHNFLQIALCLEGRGKYVFSRKEYEVSKGDVFIVNSFESHYAESKLPETIKFLFIIFLPDLIVSPNGTLFDFEYLSPFWYNHEDFCNKIDGSIDIARSIARDIAEIKKHWDVKYVGYKHLINAGLRKILGLLIRHYEALDPVKAADRANRHIKIQRAMDYIDQRYAENLSLKEVSGIIHMSESRFRHLFKEITNIGFKDYINLVRLNAAKKLLVDTDINISDIASNVGYSNISQFYKIFDKYISMTPAVYRKSFCSNKSGKIFYKNDYDIAFVHPLENGDQEKAPPSLIHEQSEFS